MPMLSFLLEFQFCSSTATSVFWGPNFDCMGPDALLPQVSSLTFECATTDWARRWGVWTSTLVTILVAVSFAVSEAILILTLRVRFYGISTSRLEY